MQIKVIVTGANGFTGKYLMQELAEHDFHAVGTWYRNLPKNMDEYEWYQIDLSKYSECIELIDKIKPDVIIHLAAQNSVVQGKQNPRKTIYNNVLSVINLLEAVRQNTQNIKCILAGSAGVYGAAKFNEKIMEDMPVTPGNMYSLTKFFQEKVAERYHIDYGMNIICTRPFNYSGYLQEENCFIPNLCRQVSMIVGRKQEPKLKLGNLNVSRDFLDVRDVVRAYRLLVDVNVPYGIYNISSGNAIRLIDIVNYLDHQIGMDIEILTDESLLRKDEISYLCGDNSKLIKATGWEVRYSVFDTVDWIYRNMQEAGR